MTDPHEELAYVRQSYLTFKRRLMEQLGIDGHPKFVPNETVLDNLADRLAWLEHYRHLATTLKPVKITWVETTPEKGREES